jgi:hypothetical protein
LRYFSIWIKASIEAILPLIGVACFEIYTSLSSLVLTIIVFFIRDNSFSHAMVVVRVTSFSFSFSFALLNK